MAKARLAALLLTIGAIGAGAVGAAAQDAAPQRSLFPEGQCGGLFCSAIGGSQAPVHPEPPPPCGGGLLCEYAPYATGASLSGSPEPVGLRAAPVPAVADAPPRPVRRRHAAHRKAAKTAAAN